MRDKFSEESKIVMLRFPHADGGSTRRAATGDKHRAHAIQAMRGARRTPVLHTIRFDEALALPTEASARIALRTQQVIAYESESQTVIRWGLLHRVTDNEMKRRDYLEKIEAMAACSRPRTGLCRESRTRLRYQQHRPQDA